MSDRKVVVPAVLMLFLCTPMLRAAEVVAERADNLGGQMIGGSTAVLIGGAAGGPIGAIAGGILGAWLGGEVQQAAGVSGDAYLIKTDDGEVHRLRSPNHRFEVGDSVAIKGIRPVPMIAGTTANGITTKQAD